MGHPTLDGFIQFCGWQPMDKVIDHSCWSTCAVGEYARYIGSDDTYAVRIGICGDRGFEFPAFVVHTYGQAWAAALGWRAAMDNRVQGETDD